MRWSEIVISGLRVLMKNDYRNIKEGRETLERAARLVPNIYYKTRYEKIPADHPVAGAWILPDGASDHVLLYFHGGGYVNGSHRTHRMLVTQIADKGKFKALIVDYRCAPEYPYPAAVEDAWAAYEYLLDQGYRPEQIAVAGDSAGGGLSLALLYLLREKGMAMPSSAVLICPWTDLLVTGASADKNEGKDPVITKGAGFFWAEQYAGSRDLKDPLISPLYGDPSGLPPVYIQAAELDLLLDDAVRMHRKIRSVNGSSRLDIYPGMFHVWQAFWILLPEAREANQRIADFIRGNFGM